MDILPYGQHRYEGNEWNHDHTGTSGQESYPEGIIRTRIRSASLIVRKVTAPEIFVISF